jgi:YHS domain-containing protein
MRNRAEQIQSRSKFGWLVIIILAVAGCGDSNSSSPAHGDDTQTVNNVCPIMPSKPVEKQFYADYEGKRYYLCCKLCVDQFNKNPKRWVAKAEKLQTLREDIE